MHVRAKVFFKVGSNRFESESGDGGDLVRLHQQLHLRAAIFGDVAWMTEKNCVV